jgi:hypothetical protein
VAPIEPSFAGDVWAAGVTLFAFATIAMGSEAAAAENTAGADSGEVTPGVQLSTPQTATTPAQASLNATMAAAPAAMALSASVPQSPSAVAIGCQQ